MEERHAQPLGREASHHMVTTTGGHRATKIWLNGMYFAFTAAGCSHAKSRHIWEGNSSSSSSIDGHVFIRDTRSTHRRERWAPPTLLQARRPASEREQERGSLVGDRATSLDRNGAKQSVWRQIPSRQGTNSKQATPHPALLR